MGRWVDGYHNEETLLRNAYSSCFNLMVKFNIESISFPNISTGRYHFPKKLAAKIALETIKFHLSENDRIKLVNIVCFDEESYEIYRSFNDSEIELY